MSSTICIYFRPVYCAISTNDFNRDAPGNLYNLHFALCRSLDIFGEIVYNENIIAI